MIDSGHGDFEAHTEPRILERSEHPVSRRDIDPRVLKVLYRLIDAGHDAYLVGGGVRDLMIGRRPKDFDVATSAHPQEVRDLFRNSRLIGRRFRLVHVFFGQHNIEVATFRRRAEDVRRVRRSADPSRQHFRHARGGRVSARLHDQFALLRSAHLSRDRLRRRGRRPATRGSSARSAIPRCGCARTRSGCCARCASRPNSASRSSRPHAPPSSAIARTCSKASVPRVVEEIYRALGIAAAARAFELMHELALFELLLAPLARFFRAGEGPAHESATGRNLAAMGRRISAGMEPRTRWCWRACSRTFVCAGCPAASRWTCWRS